MSYVYLLSTITTTTIIIIVSLHHGVGENQATTSTD